MTTQNETGLTIGASAPQFELPGTDGSAHGSHEFDGAAAAVVLFLSNHCPYVASWEDRIKSIVEEYSPRGVRFVAISSNDVGRYPKDGPEEMARRAQESGYTFPYLYDEDGAMAQAFGATRTPEVFALDRELRLQYRGAVDSSWDEEPDRDEYLRNALDAIVQGQPAPVAETPAVGCPIKIRA